MIDPIDVLEIVFTDAKTNLQGSHAKLMRATSELEAIEAGHVLTPARRVDLIVAVERWDEERLWFLADNRRGITLEDVCDAAGTEVEIVRAFYQEWLHVPFNIRKAHSALMWENSLAREHCGVCASSRCKVPQARVHNERRADWQGVA